MRSTPQNLLSRASGIRAGTLLQRHGQIAAPGNTTVDAMMSVRVSAPSASSAVRLLRISVTAEDTEEKFPRWHGGPWRCVIYIPGRQFVLQLER